MTMMMMMMMTMIMNLSEHRRLPELCILVRLQVETNLRMKKWLLDTQCKFWCSKQDFPLLIWPFLNDFVSCSITHQHRILLWNCFQENWWRLFPDHDKERPSLNLQLCYSPMLLTQFLQCLDFESAFFVPLFSYLIFATLFKPHFCHPFLTSFLPPCFYLIFATLFLLHFCHPFLTSFLPPFSYLIANLLVRVHVISSVRFILVSSDISLYGYILGQEKVD